MVLTGALIFVGCALAVVLETERVYIVPGLLPDPAPPHPVHIVSKDSVTPAPMTKPASPTDVRIDELRKIAKLAIDARPSELLWIRY